MKLRTIVKIAITSSVVLLCAGFALYSFFRLSAAEGKKDFNLYELVPPSASAVFVTDDILEFVAEVDDLACSKNQQYLHVSKLFSYLKQYLYTLQEEAPHGLSRQMNQMLISFHEPDNIHNQVLYTEYKGNGIFQPHLIRVQYYPQYQVLYGNIPLPAHVLLPWYLALHHEIDGKNSIPCNHPVCLLKHKLLS